MDIILYAVPGFLLLIIIELIAEKVRGTNYYRVHDSITSLAAGILSQLMKLLHLLLPFTVYLLIYEHSAVFKLPDTVWVWLLAFVVYDFCYYWNHRLGHEMNLLWAAHVVHHSSEEYNLTTALRQTSGSFLSYVFYLPMAVLGFDPALVVTVGALNLIYQYWVHTRHIGKLGWYEELFVTPSNHRVHHAQNDIYIDRNYGGVFILWDRLFGSFQEELDDDPVVFGITGAVSSWNPLWVNAQVYAQLMHDCWHTRNWWHKATLWFRRTGWRPPDVAKKYPLGKSRLADFEKYDSVMTPIMKVYSILQYAVNSTISLALIIYLADVPLIVQLSVIMFIVVSSLSLGAYMEGKRYGVILEYLKQSVILFSPMFFTWSLGLSLVLVVTALMGVSILIKSQAIGAIANPEMNT